MPVGRGMLNFITTLSYRWRSQQFELRDSDARSAGLRLWDANIVWRSDDDRWTVGLHGRNLTDKRYITAGYNFLRAESGHGRFPQRTR